MPGVTVTAQFWPGDELPVPVEVVPHTSFHEPVAGVPMVQIVAGGRRYLVDEQDVMTATPSIISPRPEGRIGLD